MLYLSFFGPSLACHVLSNKNVTFIRKKFILASQNRKLKSFWPHFFVWFYSIQTQFRSYGAETGKNILPNIGYYKLKPTLGVKATHNCWNLIMH
jgi:hypothetical protein